MSKPYIVRVSSTKGGTGKSVIATNLASAIALYGYDTLIIDTDSVNPSVGIYMGLQDVSMGLGEVLNGKLALERAIVPHPASGARVLPQRIDKNLVVKKGAIDKFYRQVQKTGYKFVIVDTQPGVQFPDELKWCSEALLVTIPYENACISTIKMMASCGKVGVKPTLLVNRVENKRHELSIREIEEMCEEKVSGVLDEDPNVKVGVSEHVPVYIMNKNSPFSKSIDSIARTMITRTEPIGTPKAGGSGISFFKGLGKNK